MPDIAMMAEGGPEPARCSDGQRGSTAITLAPGSNIAPETAPPEPWPSLRARLGQALEVCWGWTRGDWRRKKAGCQVCQRCKRGGARKPASPPTLLSFFSMYDTEGQRYEMMSIIDYGATYHIAGRISGHSQTELEESGPMVPSQSTRAWPPSWSRPVH